MSVAIARQVTPPPESHWRILRSEIERTMALLGVSNLAELEPRHVTQLTRLVPVGDSAGASATG